MNCRNQRRGDTSSMVLCCTLRITGFFGTTLPLQNHYIQKKSPGGKLFYKIDDIVLPDAILDLDAD
jgi:hypothetical protein